MLGNRPRWGAVNCPSVVPHVHEDLHHRYEDSYHLHEELHHRHEDLYHLHEDSYHLREDSYHRLDAIPHSPMHAPVLLGPPPPARPRRIVSLVPSLTEALAALGLDDETVGLTRFCVHPDGWKARKTIVGGTKETDPARVLALAPDLVVANREENDRAPVEAIAAAGVPVWLSDIATVADTLDALRDLGRVTNREADGERLAAGVASAFEALERPAPVRAAYLIWRDPWMTVGADTIVHDVMARGGLVNAFGDRTRYPAVTADELAEARPEAVLLSSEPFPFAEKHLEEVRQIVPGAAVALVDGEAFSWYGPRLALAPAEIARVRRQLRFKPDGEREG